MQNLVGGEHENYCYRPIRKSKWTRTTLPIKQSSGNDIRKKQLNYQQQIPTSSSNHSWSSLRGMSFQFFPFTNIFPFHILNLYRLTGCLFVWRKMGFLCLTTLLSHGKTYHLSVKIFPLRLLLIGHDIGSHEIHKMLCKKIFSPSFFEQTITDALDQDFECHTISTYIIGIYRAYV